MRLALDGCWWSKVALLQDWSAYYLNSFGIGTNASGVFNRDNAFPVLSYVRSGWMNFENGALIYLGINNYLWSGLARSEDANAYNLSIFRQGVAPFDSDYRYLAFPSVA